MRVGQGFSAFTFGRYNEDKDEVIKQLRLCIASYASFIEEHQHRVQQRKITIVGLSSDPATYSSQREKIDDLTLEFAEGLVLINPYQFLPRAEAWEMLKGAHVAMMLSWHEGFGLTGWEALAAGVPLILTYDSGLRRLLDEKHHPLEACFYVTSVAGHPERVSESDIARVVEQMRKIYGDGDKTSLQRARVKALALRETLLHQYAWRKRAKAFLRTVDRNGFIFLQRRRHIPRSDTNNG